MDLLLRAALTWQGMLAAVLMLVVQSTYLVKEWKGKGLMTIVGFLVPTGLGLLWAFSQPSNPGGFVPVVAILVGLVIAGFVASIFVLNGVGIVVALRRARAEGRGLGRHRMPLLSGAAALVLLASAWVPLYRGEALADAIRDGNYGKFRCLVAFNGNVRLTDDPLEYPLHLASYEGNARMVQWLLARGADIAKVTERGQTPLEAMFEHDWELRHLEARYDEAAALLIEGGSPISSVCMDGVFAMEGRERSVAALSKRLLTREKIQSRDPQTDQFITHSALDGELGVVRQFLELGGGLDYRNQDGMTLLLLAFWGASDELAQELMQRGADVLARRGSSASAGSQGSAIDGRDLMGCMNGTTLRMFLQKAPSLRNLDKAFPQGPPLHDAARLGHVDTMGVLLGMGANIDAVYEGETALRVAARRKRTEAVRFLVSRGADVNLAQEADQTPLVAVCGGIPELDSEGGPPHERVCESDPALVQLLLEKGARMNGYEMQAASRNGCLEIVKLLVGRGGDVNFSEDGYGTLLHSIGNQEVIDYLVSKGAVWSVEEIPQAGRKP